MFPALLRKTAKQAVTTQKRSVCESFKIGNHISWLNYKPVPPIATTRGLERGNLPLGQTGIPATRPIGEIIDFFFYNTSLRLWSRRAILAFGTIAILAYTSKPENKAYALGPSVRQSSYERHTKRYSQAPEFIRPDAV